MSMYVCMCLYSPNNPCDNPYDNPDNPDHAAMCTGTKELITGWANGRLEVRKADTGKP